MPLSGAGLVYLHYLPHWKATADKKIKLGVFSTVPAIHNYFTNALSEMIGTFMLVFSALYTGVNFKPTISGGARCDLHPDRFHAGPATRGGEGQPQHPRREPGDRRVVFPFGNFPVKGFI